jgi:hypothetical protein
MIRLAMTAALALLLSGCVTCYHKADAEPGAFERDRDDCEAKRREQGAPSFHFGKRDEFLDACMKEKGWEPEYR